LTFDYEFKIGEKDEADVRYLLKNLRENYEGDLKRKGKWRIRILSENVRHSLS
jgi:hypothetical protein